MIDFFTSGAHTIHIVSAVTSFVFALAIYMLLRNNNILKQKDWARFFAHTFLVLGAIYTLSSVYFYDLRAYFDGLKTNPDPLNAPFPVLVVNAVITLFSGLTNYFFLRSSILLLESAMSERLRSLVRRWLIRNSSARSPLFWFSCAMALIAVIPSSKNFQIPDHVLSTLALLSMGYALYRNRVKTDKAMAWVALVSAIVYATLYFSQIHHIQELLGAVLSNDLVQALTSDPIKNFIALILKFGFFFSAYSLMLWISGPLQGIESLLKSVNHEENEFFENEGIVKSIYNELGEFPVRLFVRLPGLKEKLLAVFEYPTFEGYKGPRIVKYQTGTIYDKVFNAEKSRRKDPDDPSFQLLTRPSEIGAPVFFHNSVTACLEVEVREEKFSEGNRINLERMANLISPAIQTYREMWALNKLSQDLAELQIRVKAYDPEPDLEEITEKIFNVVPASAVGISVRIGFKSYHAINVAPGMDKEPVKQRLYQEIKDGDTTTPDGTRWLGRELVILWQDDNGQRKHVFGTFLLALKKEAEHTPHTAIGTNETFRRALSDLVSDRMLSFIRGHLNQVNDQLGTRLSGLKGATVEGLEKILDESARDAGLLWALANSSTNEELNPLLKSFNSLEAFAPGGPVIEKDGFSLFKLDPPRREAIYVIKKTFNDPEETVWFGVGNDRFGPELEYISPWRYFLDHFCEIAYSALLRVEVMRREERRNRILAFLHSIYSEQLEDKNLAHQLSEIKPVRDGLAELCAAVDANSLSAAVHGLKIYRLYQRAKKLAALVDLTISRVQGNNRSPCSLNEVLAEVRQIVNDRLAIHSIELDDEISEECVIHVPFHVARAALKTIVDNSIEAISQVANGNSVTQGKIRINVWSTQDKLICAVTDNGPGVADHVLPKLFTETPESSKTNGNGIGLYLAKAWLVPFGGDIIYRQNGSTGACFLIEFPQISTNGHK
jgi:nitrogen-specific signal transduction histidine kinase